MFKLKITSYLAGKLISLQLSRFLHDLFHFKVVYFVKKSPYVRYKNLGYAGVIIGKVKINSFGDKTEISLILLIRKATLEKTECWSVR